MNLYVSLRELGLPVIAEHSELPGSVRETGLDPFRRGIAQIIVSARSLIEGFNVPAVDVGIIVASSGSVRQRIQSLGRVLRRHRSPGGEEKTSCIHVLYAKDSSEEHLYGKVDWDATTGVEQNRYFVWDLEDEPKDRKVRRDRRFQRRWKSILLPWSQAVSSRAVRRNRTFLRLAKKRSKPGRSVRAKHP